jgi:hypothetical protein
VVLRWEFEVEYLVVWLWLLLFLEGIQRFQALKGFFISFGTNQATSSALLPLKRYNSCSLVLPTAHLPPNQGEHGASGRAMLYSHFQGCITASARLRCGCRWDQVSVDYCIWCISRGCWCQNYKYGCAAGSGRRLQRDCKPTSSQTKRRRAEEQKSPAQTIAQTAPFVPDCALCFPPAKRHFPPQKSTFNKQARARSTHHTTTPL